MHDPSHLSRFRIAVFLFAALIASCGKTKTVTSRSGGMEPPAYWVWHRSSQLKPGEMATLKQAGVKSLYWQAAECAWADENWHFNPISEPMSGGAELEIIPVFRIQPQPAFLGSPEAAPMLARQINKWSRSHPAPRVVQLDFDCPDRLLGKYAAFLKAFAKAVAPTRVSITALAGWPRSTDFERLAMSVDSLAPMFYDLEADEPADVKARRFHPMADRSVTGLIRMWETCPRPWLAGLPNFERMSVFDADGKLTGHLRGWEPDSIWFSPELKSKSLDDGVTLFESHLSTEVAGTTVALGGAVVHRAPGASALRDLAEAAEKAGARGVLYFALPGPGIRAAFSPQHLAQRTQAPKLVLEVGNKGTILLKNIGLTDLPTRKWELELTSGHGRAFQSASPGGFAEMEVSGGVSAELAGSLVLRFSGLRFGETIVSGPLVHNPSGLAWRIRGLTENQPPVSENSAR
ncbi:MAG: DUF3142 domain-containing protein [Gloeobacteraceae cyanobacterium ES-bin-144]|nr:DUF3142 domain-containing protein [Verrucomicrobiales bacterium]